MEGLGWLILITVIAFLIWKYAIPASDALSKIDIERADRQAAEQREAERRAAQRRVMSRRQ